MVIKQRTIVWFIAGLLAFFCLPGGALEVTPMVQTLKADRDARGGLTVANPTNREFAFEVDVWELAFDETGVKASPSEALSVFPPALLLQPGQSHSVQIIYKKQPLSSDKSFYVRLNQQPVGSIDAEPGHVRMLLDINTVVHLKHSQFNADISVNQSHLRDDQGYIYVQNRGNGHAYLNNFLWYLENEQGQRVRIPPRVLYQSEVDDFVAANSAKHLEFSPALRDALMQLIIKGQGPWHVRIEP